MARLKLSAAALADLGDIFDFGAEQFGDDAADAYVNGFESVFDMLREHPLAGAQRLDFGPDTRCKVHRRHRILYRVADDTVYVQRILHHSRDVPRHLST